MKGGPPPPWVFLLAPAFALVVARLVSTGLARFGWRDLADAYPRAGDAPPGRVLGSGVFAGWCGYNNAIFYAADHVGLYMTALPVILAGHPPIFIPWSELEVQESRRWYGSSLELKTRRAPQVDFAVRGRAVDRMRAAFEAFGVRIVPKNS